MKDRVLMKCKRDYVTNVLCNLTPCLEAGHFLSTAKAEITVRGDCLIKLFVNTYQCVYVVNLIS